MDILRMENVTKTYRVGETICPIHEISFTVSDGDFASIEGPSGTGKSTLLYLAGGLLQPDSGRIFIKERELTTLSDTERTGIRQCDIGFIFQETHLFQALTVRENLVFAQSIRRKKNKSKAAVDTALNDMGLAERASYLPHRLSVGQRRRLIAARALLGNPALILADEPTNDLEPFWAAKLVKALQQTADAGGAVIMVTHNPEWAAKAQSHFRLHEGGIAPC